LFFTASIGFDLHSIDMANSRKGPFFLSPSQYYGRDDGLFEPPEADLDQIDVAEILNRYYKNHPNIQTDKDE